MSAQERLPQIRGKYRFNVDAGSVCRFGVGGKIDTFVMPCDKGDLIDFIKSYPRDKQVIVMGSGSNILFRDSTFSGFVIKLGKGFNYIRHDKDYLYCGGATLDPNVALYAKNHNLRGLEFLFGIPGNIGGALAMNAGAYGSDISSMLQSASAVNINTAQEIDLSVDDIGYAYRSKSLAHEWIFTDAVFKYMAHKNTQDIKDKIELIKNNRKLSQPIYSSTGGSTFKNPVGKKAWQLIDAAGCRGMRCGDAIISEQHCNFIISDNCTKSSDIIELISNVKRDVFAKFGVMLELEIKII